MSSLAFRASSLSLKAPLSSVMLPKAGFFSSTESLNKAKLEVPKKPLTTFFLFKSEKQDQLKARNPNMSVQDLTKELGNLYRSLSEAELNVSNPCLAPFFLGTNFSSEVSNLSDA